MMTDVVFVAGAFHGGWYFEPIVPALTAAGYRVSTPTLPGLGPDQSTNESVNLESHVRFLTDFLDELASDDVVLVGHSYGGMVITGAAARHPARITQMIYLDAPVPCDGQRVWDLIPEASRESFVAASPDGYVVHPAPALKAIDPRVVAHPLPTFIQPLSAPTQDLTMPRSFVLAERGSAFQSVHDRLLQNPAWDCASIPSGHDFVREAPKETADLLLRILHQPAVLSINR